MGLMDAFAADARVEMKVGDIYNILKEAAKNEATTAHLMNAIKCEVPYKHIREVMTGEKEEAEADGLQIKIPREVLDTALKEAREAMREILKENNISDAAAGQEPLFDCAGENVKCAECPNKDACDEFLSNEESEGGEE